MVKTSVKQKYAQNYAVPIGSEPEREKYREIIINLFPLFDKSISSVKNNVEM